MLSSLSWRRARSPPVHDLNGASSSRGSSSSSGSSCGSSGGLLGSSSSSSSSSGSSSSSSSSASSAATTASEENEALLKRRQEDEGSREENVEVADEEEGKEGGNLPLSGASSTTTSTANPSASPPAHSTPISSSSSSSSSASSGDSGSNTSVLGLAIATGATGLSRRTSSVHAFLGQTGSSSCNSSNSSSNLSTPTSGSATAAAGGGVGGREGGRDGGLWGLRNVNDEGGDCRYEEEEGIVVEVESCMVSMPTSGCSGEGVPRPRSLRRSTKEDLDGLSAALALAAGGMIVSGSGGGGGLSSSSSSSGGGGGVIPSSEEGGREGGREAPPARMVNSYLRSLTGGSWFSRRNTCLAKDDSGPSSSSSSSSLGSSLSSSTPFAALEKEKEKGERAELLGCEGGSSLPSSSSSSSTSGGMKGGRHGQYYLRHHGSQRTLHPHTLARAFEKKRLTIVNALRQRSKPSLIVFCPVIVLIMLLATVVSFSGEGAAAAGKAQQDLESAYPAVAAALLQGGGQPEPLARQKFTVMVNTYKRHDMAKDAVRHYAACAKVDSIRVVWSENGTSPPSPTDEKDKGWFSEHKPVFYDTYSTTSLNNRFVPPVGEDGKDNGLVTDAVFAVDDDIRVPCTDLDFAFGVWKVADESLVGFMPRIHTVNPKALRAVAEAEGRKAKKKEERRRRKKGDESREKIREGDGEAEEGVGRGGMEEEEEDILDVEAEEGGKEGGRDGGGLRGGKIPPPLFRYNGWWKVWWEGEYSLVLTKAAFLHRSFLTAYTELMPGTIRAYVDENRNCEDIAMQFLATNMTGKPPIFVRGRLTDLGVFKGISTKSWTQLGHMKSRGQCLNDFVDLYGGRMPLVKGSVVAGPAGSLLFGRPSTVFDYFSSDVLLGSGGGGGEGGEGGRRRGKALHLVPLLAVFLLIVVKLSFW
ncbi:n-acetylglucosaminyltransferase-like protein [Nannochloropsis oceanica]